MEKLTITNSQIVDIADLDCIFLTYDEPKKDEFWTRVKNMVPWARRVDGIKGSDAAHKAAAEASNTERFILIDGDNIPDENFFNLQLHLDDSNSNKIFRWKARNEINGLMYGNGGISCWTRDFVRRMRTHEATDGRAETEVEFCFDPDYWAMHDCYSVTYPNQTPFQAWRAGFREGVKMCLDRGRKPSITDFKQRVHNRNLDHLSIWHNVGSDVENGQYAMCGSQLGTYMTMLSEWDHRDVQDFDCLKDLWKEFQKSQYTDDFLYELAQALEKQLGLTVSSLTPSASAFFKHHYRSNWRNTGVMQRDQ